MEPCHVCSAMVRATRRSCSFVSVHSTESLPGVHFARKGEPRCASYHDKRLCPTQGNGVSLNPAKDVSSVSYAICLAKRSAMAWKTSLAREVPSVIECHSASRIHLRYSVIINRLYCNLSRVKYVRT